MLRVLFFVFAVILGLFSTGCRTLPMGSSGGDSVYAVFGDCYAAGAQALPLSKCFASLTAEALNEAYPKVTFFNCGEGGATARSYGNFLPGYIEKIQKSTKEPMPRAVLIVGMGDLVDMSKEKIDDQGISVSFVFKSNMESFIDRILAFSPHCRLVLCTLPDPNNGGMGSREPFQPPLMIKEFNKRIYELAAVYQLPVADLYSALMGHPEWFSKWDVHMNNEGHAVAAAVIEKELGLEPKLIAEPEGK